MQQQNILHAIIDPLCDWCYAASPLLDAAKKEVMIKLHCGGLFINERRRPVSAEFRRFALSNDRRIEALTGQPFGSAYIENILHDTSIVLDSAPPIAALLAIRELVGDSLKLLHDMQVAYYQYGKQLSEIDNLIHFAEQQGINSDSFIEAYQDVMPEVNQHTAESRSLLTQLGGQGFPTFALQIPNGEFIRLNHADYYGNPNDWKEYITKQMTKHNTVKNTEITKPLTTVNN